MNKKEIDKKEMKKKEIDKKEDNSNNTDDIEVVIGDDSVLNISEVGDIMNNLRPKDSVKNRKKFIIPISKKKPHSKEDKK